MLTNSCKANLDSLEAVMSRRGAYLSSLEAVAGSHGVLLVSNETCLQELVKRDLAIAIFLCLRTLGWLVFPMERSYSNFS